MPSRLWFPLQPIHSNLYCVQLLGLALIFREFWLGNRRPRNYKVRASYRSVRQAPRKTESTCLVYMETTLISKEQQRDLQAHFPHVWSASHLYWTPNPIPISCASTFPMGCWGKPFDIPNYLLMLIYRDSSPDDTFLIFIVFAPWMVLDSRKLGFFSLACKMQEPYLL